jgi:hypothetical protein
METQAFWNNREVELTDNAKSPTERLNAMRNKLANLDSSAMRESGIDNAAAADSLRAEIAQAQAQATIQPAGWTKDQTVARRAEWNARVKAGEFAAKPGKPTAVQVVAAEKAQGWTVADLKKFVAQWGLA